MPIIKSFSPKQNLSSFVTFLNDTDPNSRYFRISEFGETFTGGRNGFLIEGSEFLKPSTEVKIEILDVNKNPIYFTPGDGIPEYYEGVSKLISVEVYDDTPIGLGKITVLGELEKYVNEDGNVVDVPDEWKGVYNVKWEKEFKINKNLSNESIVRFVKRPKISINEIEKPSFTKTIPQVTQNGIASGEPSIPAKGTNLSNYTAGTLYKINITDSSNFTSSIDENIISFPSINYNPTVKEVLSEKTVLVDVPFTIDGLVSDFTDVSYTTTFEDLENTVTEQTTITGSFAEIFINDLKTFVGDVARVKVFRKSKNEVGDFTLVTDTRLESTEMLKDLTVATDTELSYGSFSPTNFETYWVTSSNDHVVSFDNTELFSSIRVDYDGGVGGTQLLHTSRSFNFNTDVEYTLKFKTLLSGSLTEDKFLNAFISGTNNFTQSFTNITPDATFNQRQDISANLISQYSGSGQLYFEFQGDDWYLSNVSLKNAQETSFSPDEFTLIQEVPRKLPSETFDFRFEFYDINNNFIPVEVFATKEFNGGNTADSQAVKFLSFESDRTAFRFTTGSIGNPAFQQVAFSVGSNGLSGSILFTSQAFDIDGNLITSTSYHDSGVLEYPSGFSGSYPGTLTNVSNQGATLLIGNFTGSVESVTVGSIIYTASADGLQDFESIFRFEDGENAPALFATTNTNQFIYEPTHLEPKPLAQDLRIQVKRKNLASLITPITANSSSDVPLTEVVDEGGIKTFSLSATEFSSSIISGNDGPYDSVTYSFTASGEFGNEFSDEVTISPVINFDAVSIVLSNESTTFRANSVGSILDDLSEGNGTVSMNIGNQSISHNDGLGSRNTFDIVSVSGTNVTPLSVSPTTNLYGISAMSADNGTLDITVDYLAGDNATSQSFSKKVNYGKNRSAPPTIELTTTNKTQNVSANSSGVQADSFDDSVITLQEFYTGSSKTFGSSDVTIDFQSNPSTIATDNGNLTISYSNLADGTNSANVIFSASVVDSEGTSRDIVDSISLSKSPAGQDGEGRIVSLTFTDNSVAYNADGTNPDPASITMAASSSGFTSPVFKFTGGGSYFTDETTFTPGTGANDSAIFTTPTSYITTPLTFQVEVQEASDASSNAIDRESVIFVKPGQDTRPRFIIKPLNGTQIKNASGNLELQVVRIDGSGSFDISGSAQGDAEIYSGSVKLNSGLTGISSGSNGVTYNPIISPSAISGTLELTLQETDGTILDSINLLDVTDGLGGGSFLVPNGLLMRRSGSVYTPSTLGVTASFFDATGSEFRADVLIGSNFNGTLDQMNVTAGSTNPNISFTANDGDDNNIPLNGTFANTKDVNIVSVFTEPSTNKTNTITETFFIISDGQDGSSAKSLRLSSNAQAFIEAKDGTVTPTSITFTSNRQNTNDSSTTFGPLSLLSSVGSDTATLTSESFGSNTSVTISGSADSQEVSDEITIVKLVEGSDGITIVNTNQSHTMPSDPTGSVLDFGSSGTNIKAFEGANSLTFTTGTPSSGEFKINVVETPSGKLNAFSISGNGTDTAIVSDFTSMDIDTDSVVIAYQITGSRSNGTEFTSETTQTLTKSKEGPEAVQVTNTNSSVAVSTDSDGLNPDLTDSGTEIQVFEGVNTLTFTTGTPTTSQYSASVVATNITVGSISGNGTDTLTVGDHSSFNQDSGSIIYTLRGVRANGNDFITQTTQNFKKIRAGSDGADGVDGVDGANGADGAAGADARAVNLTSTDQSIEYDTEGNNPSPSSVTITATAVNTNGTVYYEFFLNDVSQQNLTTNTYALTPESSIDNMPQKVEVQIREGSSIGTILARDQITVFGIKDGSDAYTIILTNEAHTLPVTNTGTVTYTGSGTSIIVYKGITELNGVTSGTPTTGEFSVSAVGTNITPNASPTSTGNPIVYGVASNITSDNAFITFTINIENTVSFEKIQSFSKSVEGQDGAPGDSGTNAVSVTPSITSQNVTRTISVSPNTFTTVTNITFSVVEGATTFTPIAGSSTLTNSTYKVKTSSLVNCTEGGNGIISPTQPSLSSPNGFTATFTIQYKDSSGNENEIDFSHVVTVTPEGDTGPGIVHTGVWESGRVYQFGTGATGRRDSVLWSANGSQPYNEYYATIRQHTSTTGDVADGPPNFIGSNATGWESLGQQDLFVAAKIGIFEDSFIQNTLNVGSSNNGGVSSANITIFGGTDSGGSANPYISMGQAGTIGSQGYSVGGGIFLGSDSNDDKFKLSIEGTISAYKFESLGEDEFIAVNAFNDYPNSLTTTLYGSDPVLDENTILYTNIALSSTFDGENKYYSDGDTVVRINGSGVVTPQSGYTSTSPNSVGVSTSTNSLKWNGDELQIVGDINVTGGNAATGDQASATVVFFDDFSSYPTVADVTSAGDDPKTDGSGQGYFAYQGPSVEKSFVIDDGELFGKNLQLGNNSGNDEVWLTSNRLIPFNENSLYEIEIRIKNTSSASGLFYVGVTAFKKDGTTIVKRDGVESTIGNYGKAHYFALFGDTINSDFTIYRGYFRGTSTSTTTNGLKATDKDNPGTIHASALNGFIAPSIVNNYNDNPGQSNIDFVKITEFNVGGGSTRISGDSIKTGQIKSNNLSSTAGSVLDLNAGTIKLGGTSDPNFEVTSAGHVTAKGGGSIAGWDITDSQLQSSNLSGGGDGSFTTQGILINTNGYISAKNFFISSDGLPKFNGVLTSSSGSLGGWQLNENALTSPDDTIELSSTGKAIRIHRSNGEVDLELRQGGLSDLNASNIAIAWSLDEYSQTIRSSTPSQLKVTSTTNFDSSVRFANNSTDSFVLTDVGTYTLASPNFQMRGILSDAGSLELETGVGGFDIGDQEYTITLGYAIVTNPADKEGSVVYRNNDIGSVTLTSGSSGVTGGDTTFTVNDTISIGNTSVSTTYYLYGLLSLDGTVSGGTLDVDAIFNAKSGINFVKALDIVELTGEGVQIAKSSTRYVQMPKTTLTKVLTLGGGLMIHQGGTGTANGITFTSGSSDDDTVEWRMHKGGGEDLFLQYKNLSGTVTNTHTFRDNGNFDILGSVGSISSRKIKENIINLPSQKEIIEKLQPVHYTKIINNQEEIGLIAEDVHEIIPNLVSYDKQGNPNGIFYSKLSVVLLDVVKRQGQEIQELKQRLDNLENI